MTPWDFLFENMVFEHCNLKKREEKREDLLKRIFKSKKVVFDVVYSKRITPFLSEAKNFGALCIDGKEMLLNQGARSFELWTGKTADKRRMRRALESSVSYEPSIKYVR